MMVSPPLPSKMATVVNRVEKLLAGDQVRATTTRPSGATAMSARKRVVLPPSRLPIAVVLPVCASRRQIVRVTPCPEGVRLPPNA